MQYETGQLLWGAAKSVGNVWIVTDGPNRLIALLLDGTTKQFCPHYQFTKHDYIKATSFLYELTGSEIHSLPGRMPQWAVDFMKKRPVPISNYMTGVNLAPSVVQKVQQALNVSLTPPPAPATVTEDVCPVNREHRFVPYTGLNQSFEYCVHCDAKRSN